MPVDRAHHFLVTGGAGFIGSHVVRRLLAQGHQVVVFDNLASGLKENLTGLGDGLELVVGDVRDADLLQSVLAGVDVVVHLAAEPLVQVSIARPLETHSVNYVGTLTLLEAMRKTSVDRIVYASSAAVYPQNTTGPVSEETVPDPSSPYGMDKLFGEYALRTYRKLHGIRGTTLRFFNIYGERQQASSPYSGVISVFADRLTGGKPLTVYGDGLQSRDFVYAGDLAKTIERVACSDDAPDLMNVGTGNETNLLELIAALEQASGMKSETRFEPRRPGDVVSSCADVRRLAAHPEWVPSTPLREGLGQLLRSLAG